MRPLFRYSTVIHLMLSFSVEDGPFFCESNPMTDCWNGTKVLTNQEEKTLVTDDILEQSE